MDDSFFAYLQHLELISFFSGYPLVYAIILVIAGNKKERSAFKTGMVSLLPRAYALVGTLFWGYQLKKLYPDYSVASIKLNMQPALLIIWGLLSILFWIPPLGKRKVLTLIHSLVFFFFIVQDTFLQLFTPSANNDIINNDMKVYTYSLFLNACAFAVVLLISFLLTLYKKRQKA